MNDKQKKFAREEAYKEAGIVPADWPSVESAYRAHYDRAREVGLADEGRSLESALLAQGASPEMAKAGVATYKALEAKASEKQTGFRGRRALVATLVVALLICTAIALFPRLGDNDDSARKTPPSPTAVVQDVVAPADEDIVVSSPEP